MFCPKCGTSNQIEQKYCRKCGHGLTGHRAALEGNFDQAATHLRKGESSVGTGLVILGICALNVVANWLLSGSAVGILINLAIGLMVAVPFIIIGLMRLDRANKIFNPVDTSNKAIDDRKPQTEPAPLTDSTAAALSVTENTTLELEKPRPSRRRRS